MTALLWERAGRSAGKAVRIFRTGGVRSIAQRVAQRAYVATGAASLREPLLPGDLADSTRIDLPLPQTPVPAGQPLQVGWVTAPPSLGSGGHTTMFRMVEALERAGHQCTLFFYDRYLGDLESQEATVRRGWPTIRAEVRDARLGITGVDACFATSWDTAHVLARYGTQPMHRLYFIQDYEPYFYARGSEYALAEDSYRFGFRNIALGHMVANCLRRELGVSSDVTSFGCDTAIYRLQKTNQPRSGILLYARPGTPRRGYWLARMALAEFHTRHPDVPIHIYGARVPDLGFPATVTPRLSPDQLNQLYNRSVAGVALSFTNISLVAEELLAAGVIPVVNDSADARADIDNAHVAWATPTPGGIADALSALVSSREIEQRAAAAAATVREGWGQAGSDIVRIVEGAAYGSGRGATANTDSE